MQQSLLNTTELARELGVTKGRISQLVSAGKLEGCYHGDGRLRRFDLDAVARKLGKRLDKGQLMGNGAGTRRALERIRDGEAEASEPDSTPAPESRRRGAGAEALPDGDSDRYELARTQKAEEEARRLRRQNAEAEGRYVLASEVSAQVARVVGQEVAEFETVLRDAARALADELGIDFRTARQVMLRVWRTHRSGRAEALDAAAQDARMAEAEREQDI